MSAPVSNPIRKAVISLSGKLEIEEIAKALGVGTATVKRVRKQHRETTPLAALADRRQRSLVASREVGGRERGWVPEGRTSVSCRWSPSWRAVTGLVLKRHFSGPGELLVHAYGGNVSASFAACARRGRSSAASKGRAAASRVGPASAAAPPSSKVFPVGPRPRLERCSPGESGGGRLHPGSHGRTPDSLLLSALRGDR